jgi:CofH subfamily radical SAM domain protein
VKGFTAVEIDHLARLSGRSSRDVLAALVEAGLGSRPGGGAEVLVDRVRREISPDKIGWREWAGVMEAAHRLGMPTTATMMFGSTETDEDLVDHLLPVRELQARTGGFTAFIPWTFQPTHTELGRSAVPRPAGAVRYLWVLAVSRLVLDNVANLQASWVTQGEKVAQVALRFGANDLGSTMLEENVVAAAGVHFGLDAQRWVDLIADAGFRPAQRTTTYQVLREFPGAESPPEWGSGRIREREVPMKTQGKEGKGSERRREPRFDRRVPVRVAHDSADGLRAESINVSTRGLYCKAPRYVPPFAKLKVALELPFASREAATVECEGVVVRVEPESATPGVREYRLAVYFLDLPRESAELIAQFLDEAH